MLVVGVHVVLAWVCLGLATVTIGLLLPAHRYAAGIGLFVLTILVTPANIHMALNPALFPAFSKSLLYWRLVAQVGLLAFIYAVAIRRPLSKGPA